MTQIELKMKGGNSSLRLFYTSPMPFCEALIVALRDAKRRYPGCGFKLVDIRGPMGPKYVEKDSMDVIERDLQMKKMRNANISSNKAQISG